MEISLISSIHKPENLIDDAIHIAQELVEKSAPISIAITRQMLWRSFGQSHPYDAHVIESKAIDSRGASDDAKEGVNSFLGSARQNLEILYPQISDFFFLEELSVSVWTSDQAFSWYNKQDWLVGCNYLPSSCINQIEMFQEDTFNIEEITFLGKGHWF